MAHKHKKGKVPPQERKGNCRQNTREEEYCCHKKNKRGRVPQQERKSNGGAKTQKRKSTVRWRKNIREEEY